MERKAGRATEASFLSCSPFWGTLSLCAVAHFRRITRCGSGLDEGEQAEPGAVGTRVCEKREYFSGTSFLSWGSGIFTHLRFTPPEDFSSALMVSMVVWTGKKKANYPSKRPGSGVPPGAQWRGHFSRWMESVRTPRE